MVYVCYCLSAYTLCRAHFTSLYIVSTNMYFNVPTGPFNNLMNYLVLVYNVLHDLVRLAQGTRSAVASVLIVAPQYLFNLCLKAWLCSF